MNTRDKSLLGRMGWLLLILLTAVFLRLHQLAEVPPGLTHDEADHALTALSILNEGVRDIYFTVGYGREPLFDYLTAGLIAALGPTHLAGRLAAVYASLLLIAGLVAWVSRAFDWRTALFSGAGLAVGFWPVMAARQGLRSILLPALFVLAVLFFWRGLEAVARATRLPSANRAELVPFLIAGLLLGLSIYSYIPARGLWLVFPALLGYWFFVRRDLLRAMWWRVGLMLGTMLIVAAPLLRYLQQNPTAELRIEQLAEPVQRAQQGDFGPLLDNIAGGLRLFFLEGDLTWRYNIPGKPLLGPLWAALFILGLSLALLYVFRKEGRESLIGSASFFSLAWLGAGVAPALITGPALSMTQAIGMQPVLYVFPALALGVATVPATRAQSGRQPLVTVGLLILFLGTAVFTYRDYFSIWATDPEVRVQYEATLVTTLDYLAEHGTAEALVSTIAPGPFHSAAVAQALGADEQMALRWFDGRGSLVLPRAATATAALSGFAPLNAALEPYFATAVAGDTLPLRPTDHDRPVQLYLLDRSVMEAAWHEHLQQATEQFGDQIALLGYDLQTPQLAPGETLRLITYWVAGRPLPDAVLFTHLLGPDGVPVAQADRLDVPGYSWQAGDTFLQLHEVTLPVDLPPGDYALAVGVYTRPDGKRLSTAAGADLLPLVTVRVQQ